MKLTPKLALVFISFAFLLLLGVGALAYYNGRNALIAATYAELDATSVEKSAALDTWTLERQAAITAISRSPGIVRELQILLDPSQDTNAARDHLLRELSVYMGAVQPFLGFLILSPETGEVIFATNPQEEGKFKENQPYFIEGKANPFVTKVYYSLQLQSAAMTASAPLRTENGQLIGVIAGRLNLEELNAIIQRRSGLRQTDDAFLVNTSNLFITQPRLLPDPAVLQRGIHTPAVKECLKSRSHGTISTIDYRGIPAITTYRWLPSHDMCLIVKVEESEALAPVQAFGRAIGWVTLITLAVASLLALALSRTLIRPILAMQKAAQDFGHGRLDARLAETRRDELGMLAHEFNQMAASLLTKDAELRAYAQTLEQRVQERTRELHESNAQLLRAEEVGQMGSWEWQIAENRVNWSNGLFKVFGLTEQEFRATYEAYLERVHPEDRAYVEQVIDHAFQAGGAFEFESRILRKDDDCRHLYTRGEMIFDEQHNPARMMGIAIDITERKQAEAWLRESEAQLKFSQRVAHLGHWTWDTESNRVTWSDEMYRLFGLDPETFEGDLDQVIDQAIHPDDRAKVNAANRAVVQTGKPSPLEYRVLLPDQSVRTVWAEAGEQIRDQAGNIVRLSGIVQDITQRKQAEEALRESETRFRSLFENMPTGYAHCQILFEGEQPSDFIYISINPAFKKLTGLKDVIGKKVSAVISGVYESSPELFEVYARVAQSGKPEWFETCIEPLDTWFSISVYSPKLGEFVAVFENITERKRAERELQQANARFQRMVDSNIVGIVIADASGKVLLANDYYLNILGVTRQDFIEGKVDWRQFTPPDWLPADEKAIQELLERGVCEPYEKEYVRADGTRVAVYLADAMLPGPYEQIIAFVLDITERKHAENEVRELNMVLEDRIRERTAELETINKELEAFSYSVSHDLRAPIRHISGFIDLLNRNAPDLDAKNRRYLGTIAQSAQQMGILIDELLAFSRMGRAEVRKTAVDLDALVHQIIPELQVDTAGRDVVWKIGSLPEVYADRILLKSVLINLISNAVKFTSTRPQAIIEIGSLFPHHTRLGGLQSAPEGGAEGEGEGEIVYFVRDNGVGFDMQYVDKLFGLFQRLHRADEFEGTGVGLANVRRIIHRHGGRTWAEGELDRGATFYFSLPYQSGE